MSEISIEQLISLIKEKFALRDEIDEDNDSKLDIAKSKDEIESNNYKLDKWNPWTDKSQDISFKSNKSGVGDGEAKLGAEYDTAPNGQNSSHDLRFKYI